MTDIHEGFADLGSIKLHYAEAGAANKELVILLHGFPEFWFTWRKQIPEIGKTHHVVAPDMRGYNLSQKPEALEAYKIKHLIDDVVRLAKYFGADTFYLASHDWGAAVAWSVALARPDLIKGLMVLNGPHPYIFAKLLEESAQQIQQSKYMADFRENGMAEKLSENNFEWLWDWTFADHEKRGLITAEEKAKYIEAWGQPGAITSMLNYYRASPLMPRQKGGENKPLPLNPDHFKVTVPTLVIWGQKDHALVSDNLNNMRDFVPDLKLITLENVTHWVTHEAPELVSNEILEFIDEIEGRSVT